MFNYLGWWMHGSGLKCWMDCLARIGSSWAWHSIVCFCSLELLSSSLHAQGGYRFLTWQTNTSFSTSYEAPHWIETFKYWDIQMAKNNGQELSLYKAPLLLNPLSELTQDTLQKSSCSILIIDCKAWAKVEQLIKSDRIFCQMTVWHSTLHWALSPSIILSQPCCICLLRISQRLKL